MPRALVVKSGSNIFSTFSGGMPQPLSVIAMIEARVLDRGRVQYLNGAVAGAVLLVNRVGGGLSEY